MRVPPQNGELEDCLESSPTCQGYSFSSVGAPPTIFCRVLACPHLHEPEGAGAGAGAGAGDGEGEGLGGLFGGLMMQELER